MNLNLDGKIALVTGGASGIGACIAGALADEGCIVYIGDINLEAAQDVGRSLGSNAHAIRMDVSDPEDVQTTVEQIAKKTGGLDILINNAGILRTESVMESTIEDWDRISKINLSSVYYCSKAVLPIMRNKKYGKIVNMASISAMKGGGTFGNVLYGTTKAGVVAMTKGFARELAPFGINVNAIAPAVTETAMTNELIAGELRERLLAGCPMQRFARASEVASLALFLVSDVSGYITGETIVIDGGRLTN